MPRGIKSDTEFGEGVQVLREHAATVGEDVKELASRAGELARARLGPAESYIRDRPLSAVFIAAGVGIVLGMLWRWRS